MWQTIIKELTQATLDMVHGILQFLPRLAGMLIVVVFGWVIASTIRTIIIVFAVSMGFEELGIGEHTTLVAFAIVFGALMLGLALAFGLGGRDLARHFLERRFVHERREEKEDELSPL